MKKYAVILAGGVGERFWPLSRKDAPKYLWNVAGGGKSLLSMTFERVSKLLPAKNILVIAGGAQIKNIRKVCPEIPASQLVGEPVARDTTAAIGLAAVLVGKMAKGEDASFAVLPSDHMISDTGGFVKTMRSAFGVAEGGDRLVTIGIAPAYPATGFGYIRRGREFGLSSGEYYKVARFCEKPDLKKAQRFLADGGYFWNAGIFVWKVSSILGAIEKNIPQTFGALTRMKGEIESGVKTARAAAKYYPEIEKISIDFSVMERAKNAYVVPQNFDWDDVGSWNALERHLPKDENGNVARGELYASDASGCIVFDAAGRSTALLGVDDVVVVHSGDSTLVCSKKYAEKLKDLVKLLPEKYR